MLMLNMWPNETKLIHAFDIPIPFLLVNWTNIHFKHYFSMMTLSGKNINDVMYCLLCLSFTGSFYSYSCVIFSLEYPCFELELLH